MSELSASNTVIISGVPPSISLIDGSKAFPDSTWPCGGDYFNVNRISTEKVCVDWNITSFLRQCCEKGKELRSEFFAFAGARWNLFISFDRQGVHSLFGINVRDRRSSDEVLNCYCRITFEDSLIKIIKETECYFRCVRVNSHGAKKNFLQKSELEVFSQLCTVIHCEIRVKRSNTIKEVCPPAEVPHSSSSSAGETHTRIGLLKYDSVAFPDSAWPSGGDYFNVNRISTEEVYVDWNIESFVRQCCGKAKELRSDFFSFADGTWNLFTSFDLEEVHSLFGINVRDRRSPDEVLDCYCDITFKDSFRRKIIKETECEFRCERANTYGTKEDFLPKSELEAVLQRGTVIHCEIRLKRSTSVKEECPPAEVTHSGSSSAEETYTRIELLKCYSIAFPDSSWTRDVVIMSSSTEEMRVTWFIEFPVFLNFLREKIEVRSVGFYLAGATWNLFASFDQKKCHSLIGINIRERMSSDADFDCNCNICLKLECGRVIKNIKFNFKCENSESHVALTDFLSHSKLNEFLKRGDKIECQIRENKSSIKKACSRVDITQPSSSRAVDPYTQTQQLEKDFKKLLLSEEGSDVTLQVQDQPLKAHRSILIARSSFFAAMFRHDTKEKTTGVVDVHDCEPTTFQVLLEFMYCGSTEKLSVENMFSLYTAADKYDLQDLKMKCLYFIQSNLSVETFCKTLQLSLQHSETNLLKLAEEFFIRNCQRILLTTEWQTFNLENGIQGNELFIKAAKYISLTPENSSQLYSNSNW